VAVRDALGQFGVPDRSDQVLGVPERYAGVVTRAAFSNRS
jgi:hypothetical protein